MTGESNLDTLLQTMKPALQEGAFVFLTSPSGFPSEVEAKAVMIFREIEGVTVIVRQEIAEKFGLATEPAWAMITLTVHSDLAAVGFLAVITSKLAAAGISVNPVSAFYHDHLFVPVDKKNAAMDVLSRIN